jgi:hypothetical protein
MKRWFVAMVLVLGVCVKPAQGQPQIGSYTRPQVNPHPTVSPFLNLTRGGNAAVNYYGIIRPQQQTQRQIHHLQHEFQGIQATETLPAQEGADPATRTGRPIGGFFNYSHYYPLYGRGGAGQAGSLRR